MARRGQWGYRLLTEDWQHYDKYFGDTLELRGLSHRQLEFLQVLTYLSFYLGTGRLWELGKFVSQFRREAWRMLRNLFRLPGGAPSAPRRPDTAGEGITRQDLPRTALAPS